MARKNIKDLSDLKNFKFKKNSDSQIPKTKVDKVIESVKKNLHKKETEEPIEENNFDEDDAFMAAMSGVKQLDNTEVVAQQKKVKAKVNASENSKKLLTQIIEGKIEFDIEYSDDFMYGFVKGTDPKIFQKLKSGTFSKEDYIDLHGMTADQAKDNLTFFLQEAYLQNKRCVHAVTGKGKNSPGGQSVLKREVQDILTHYPFKKIVIAFCTAQPRDGGAGAIYILLRKHKKNKGKIKWDKNIR